jgi:hypothetical protein
MYCLFEFPLYEYLAFYWPTHRLCLPGRTGCIKPCSDDGMNRQRTAHRRFTISELVPVCLTAQMLLEVRIRARTLTKGNQGT